MEELARKLVGKFIVIDGPDGAGKTTQLKKLREYLGQLGLGVQVAMDPGTTPIGQKIRAMLLDRDNGEIGPMCETLLFMASRAQLVDELLRPAIAAGQVVVCDRFVSATVAYQGASGIDKDMIIKLADIAIGGLWPDLTIILDISTDLGFERLGLRRSRLKQPGREELEKLGVSAKSTKKEAKPSPGQLRLFGDRLEIRSSNYQEQVRTIFRELAGYYPRKVRCVEVGHDKGEDDVFALIQHILNEEFVMRNEPELPA